MDRRGPVGREEKAIEAEIAARTTPQNPADSKFPFLFMRDIVEYNRKNTGKTTV